MAEFPAPSPAGPSTAARTPSASGALLAYALFGAAAVMALISSGFPVASPLLGIVGIAGLIVAYVKRDEAAGTWIASHLRWLIRTFWFSFLWGVVGCIVLLVLGIILIGIPIAFLIWGVASIWVLYRVIRGYLLFKDEKPIPGM
jgi:uncharacterized membrane protein